MKARYLCLSVLAATALSISAADATVLLTFGQTSSGDTVTGTRLGGTTTITSTGTQVDITEIDATPPLVTPFTATLDFSATNVGQATNPAGPIDVFQRYSGSFSITNGATDYLSGTFTDAVFGSGGALTLNASGPGESVTFSSNVIAPALIHGLNPAIALSFTDVTPGASIGGPVGSRSLNSFRSDVSGDFSNTAVPEPSTWAMMLLGFAGLAYAGYRRTSAPRIA